MSVLRLLRGVLATSLVWAFAWAALGAGLAVVSAIAGGASEFVTLRGAFITGAVFFGLVGVWAGGAFASIMAFSERRRVFTELTMRRVVTWGILGGVSYPVVPAVIELVRDGPRVGGFGGAVMICGGFGAISAWAMLRAARRSDPRPPLHLGEGPAGRWHGAHERMRDHARTT